MSTTRNVYLAARYIRKDEMRVLIPALNEAGWGVPARWLAGHELDDPTDVEAMRKIAQEDLADVASADVVIAFTEAPGTAGAARGGRHVEFGLALHRSITIVVGPVENVFHSLATFRFDTFEEALAMLRAYNPR